MAGRGVVPQGVCLATNLLEINGDGRLVIVLFEMFYYGIGLNGVDEGNERVRQDMLIIILISCKKLFKYMLRYNINL